MKDMNSETDSEEISQRAVSLYGQNEGVDDFPVLKAFQQYIDAEQEKARKRIIWLGIVFGAILILVVIVFMVMLHGINVRNQSLSDRLVEYAMKEADRRQQLVQQGSMPQNESTATLKAMTETLVAIQKNIETSKDNAEKVRREKNTHDLTLQQESLRMQRLRDQIEAEKKKLAEERERLHQEEVERQRRKMYPEFYEKASASGASPSQPRVRTLTDEDIREILKEAYPELDRTEESPKNHAKKIPQDKSVEEETDRVDDDSAVEYFKDDDYTIPVDVKGSDTKVRFTVPIDG